LLTAVKDAGQTVLRCTKRLGKTIQIMFSYRLPVTTILRRLCITASINIITWNKAYSVFPRQAIIHHKLYTLKPLSDGYGSYLREPSGYDWTNRHIVWPDLSVEARPRVNNGYRRMRDQSSWVISLDTRDVRLAPVPDSLIKFAQFGVATESEPFFPQGRSARQGSPQIHVRELATGALRHGLTFASDSWHQFVTERAQRWIWPELLKLEVEERPRQLRSGLPNHHDISLPSDFRLPES